MKQEFEAVSLLTKFSEGYYCNLESERLMKWVINYEAWHYWPQLELYLVYISDLNHFYLPEKVCLSSIKIDWAVNKSMSKPEFAAIGSCDLLRSPVTMYLHVHPRTTSFNPIRTKSLSTTVPWILVDKRYDSYLMSANHCVMGWIIPCYNIIWNTKWDWRQTKFYW